MGRSCGSEPVAVAVGRPVAAAPIQHLAWELPYATGVGLKRKKIYIYMYVCIYAYTHMHIYIYI